MTSFSINLANIAPAKQHSFLFIYSVKTNFYNLNALCIFAPQKVKSNLSFEKEQEKKTISCLFFQTWSQSSSIKQYGKVKEDRHRQGEAGVK